MKYIMVITFIDVSGDVVEMKLNLDDLTIFYKKNNKDYGEVCGLSQDKYRLAIHCNGVNDEIELL